MAKVTRPFSWNHRPYVPTPGELFRVGAGFPPLAAQAAGRLLSRYVTGTLEFVPRTYPSEELLLKWGSVAEPLSLAECPEGLRNLMGSLVDAALVLDMMTRNATDAVGRKCTSFKHIRTQELWQLENVRPPVLA